MEAHYPKYLLYCLLIAGSWLLSCVLHFQYFQSLSSSFTPPRRAAACPSSLPPPSKPTTRRWCRRRLRHHRRASAASVRGALQDCVDGSPLFDDIWSWCAITVQCRASAPRFPPPPAMAPPASSPAPDVRAGGDVHNWMRRYECLTDDPSTATAVYVPYYPALELHQHLCGYNTRARDGPSEARRGRPLGGRDHFIGGGEDDVDVPSNPGAGDDGCGNNFLGQPGVQHLGPHATFAVAVPELLPPVVLRRGVHVAVPRRARRTGRSSSPSPARGGSRGSSPSATRVFDVCEASRRCGMVDCSHGLEGSITCRTAAKLVGLFTSARFCLQPRGTPSCGGSSIDSRPWLGASPSFFHRASTLEAQYRWHEPEETTEEEEAMATATAAAGRYYVLLNSDDVLKGGRYSDEEVAAMREEVIRMIPRFMYRDPRVAFEGEKMRDAFDITMDGMMDRMRRIKNGEDVALKGEDDSDEAAMAANDS
ncbi:hypothetical protein HU200_014294 [Digitaria exilis]|uniref:Exostosin GT47 domain-containing protein n=1 Tax=Digitaria exilis TaxID=1010633 RepID=A0A835KIY7_9POAL|nr:hypothetical protein HU200_014294 [Digitaria exilis]